MKRALLRIGGACNNRCVGCPTAGERQRRATRDQVRAGLARLAAAGFEAVTLAGGEPTLRRALPGWISAARRLGLEVTLRTNGRLLAYRGLAGALAARGLTAFEVKLPSVDASTHRALTRAEGLAQTLDGLAAASRAAPTRVRVPLLAARWAGPAGLVAVVEAVARHAPGATVVFAHQPPPPPPPWELLQPALEAALARAQARGLRAQHEGLPLCLVPGREDAAVEPELEGVVATLWPDAGALRWEGLDRPPAALACHACTLEPRCPGPLAPPAGGRPQGDPLRPRLGLRSNSFHYAPRGAPRPWPPGTPCPALALDTAALDPARGLFVCQDDTLSWCETRSRDFGRAALWSTRARRGQVYLDVSGKAAADDFARDLAALVPVDACRACPRRTRGEACPGALRPRRGEPGADVFTRDDAAVREVLAALEGDVLDVGCGEGPYLDALAARVQAGRVRYRGVDPDAASLERLRARWPSLALEAVAAEELRLAPASLDAALILRSYNHLRHPEAVLAGLARALRPGGTLLLVDNVAFGLVRTAAQVARAEAGPGAFEHYRNATAAQARALVERAAPGALRLVEERPVGPGTSNQWLLRYERTEAPASPPAAGTG